MGGAGASARGKGLDPLSSWRNQAPVQIEVIFPALLQLKDVYVWAMAHLIPSLTLSRPAIRNYTHLSAYPKLVGVPSSQAYAPTHDRHDSPTTNLYVHLSHLPDASVTDNGNANGNPDNNAGSSAGSSTATPAADTNRLVEYASIDE